MRRFALCFMVSLLTVCAFCAGTSKFGKMKDNDWVVTNAWQAMKHRVTPTSEWAGELFDSEQFSNAVNNVASQGGGWTTNAIEDIVRSETVTNAGAVAYTDHAISQIHQGTDTNAVQGIIQTNIDTNYLFTVEKAEDMESRTRGKSDLSVYVSTWNMSAFTKIRNDGTYYVGDSSGNPSSENEEYVWESPYWSATVPVRICRLVVCEPIEPSPYSYWLRVYTVYDSDFSSLAGLDIYKTAFEPTTDTIAKKSEIGVVVTNHVTSGYLCTVAAAQAMTNSVLAKAKADAAENYFKRFPNEDDKEEFNIGWEFLDDLGWYVNLDGSILVNGIMSTGDIYAEVGLFNELRDGDDNIFTLPSSSGTLALTSDCIAPRGTNYVDTSFSLFYKIRGYEYPMITYGDNYNFIFNGNAYRSWNADRLVVTDEETEHQIYYDFENHRWCIYDMTHGFREGHFIASIVDVYDSTNILARSFIPLSGGTAYGTISVTNGNGKTAVKSDEVNVGAKINGAEQYTRMMMKADKKPQLAYYREKSGETTLDYDYYLPLKSGKIALSSSTSLNEMLFEANTNSVSSAENECIKSNMTHIIRDYVDTNDESIRQIVYTWEQFLDGSNVVFSITNYISGAYNLGTAKFRILEMTNGVYREVYNSRDEIVMHLANFKTNDLCAVTNDIVSSVDSKIDGKADRAWGKYTSTGADVADVYASNTVYMTEPTTVFAGGTEYTRFAVGEGSICILTTKGMNVYTSGEEGTFRFQDSGGTNYFGFARSDSYTIGASVDGIVVNNNLVTITFDIVSSVVPCMWYMESLDNYDPTAWEMLNLPTGDPIPGASHLVSWEPNPPEGKRICYINVTGEAKGFFRGTIEVAGSAKFVTNMPADLSAGIVCTNTATGVSGVIFPSYDGSSVTWTWRAN